MSINCINLSEDFVSKKKVDVSVDGFREYYQRANGSLGVRSRTTGHSRVDQSLKDETDATKLVKRIQMTGNMPVPRGMYADVSAQPSLEQQLQARVAFGSMFENLPAALRDRFQSPRALFRFLDNPENLAEARRLGLVPKVPEAGSAASAAGGAGGSGPQSAPSAPKAE